MTTDMFPFVVATIMSFSHGSWLITGHHRIFNISNTTDAICGAGNAYPYV